MLDVSTDAKTKLGALLDAHRTEPGQVIRLVVDRNAEFSVVLSSVREGDVIVEDDDGPILVVDAGTGDLLDGMILDTEGAGPDAGLRVVGRKADPAEAGQNEG